MLFLGTESDDEQQNTNYNGLLEDFGITINSDCLVCMEYNLFFVLFLFFLN